MLVHTLLSLRTLLFIFRQLDSSGGVVLISGPGQPSIHSPIPLAFGPTEDVQMDSLLPASILSSSCETLSWSIPPSSGIDLLVRSTVKDRFESALSVRELRSESGQLCMAKLLGCPERFQQLLGCTEREMIRDFTHARLKRLFV